MITTIIADDTTDRLLDGGALDATPLARGPIAALRAIKNTGELKGLVADAGDLELQIRSLHNFGPPEDRDAELSTAHTDMSRLNWPDVAVREPYERVHLTPCYGLDQRPLPTSYSWLPQVTPNTLIGGEITHVIGQCLAIQTDVGCVVLPTETLTGWTVLNIE